MKPVTSPLDALYARVSTPAIPAVPLARRERRRAGEGVPTVPAGGLQWSPMEVAAALFEVAADDELAGRVPSTDTLYAVLCESVAALGPAGLAEVVATFADFGPGEFPEADACWTFAYRLALSLWYEGARSRPMTAGEAAVALYLSDAYRHHQVDAVIIRRAPLLVSRAIRQGAALVPAETLMRLGEAMGREFASPAPTCVTGPSRAAGTGRDWLYRQALPDYHRRRFCFRLLRADTCQPSPLIVRLDGGGYAVGATPPAGPGGTWLRPVRAEW
ncbi:hypothetical protein [Streptomyces iranensis]|uniref:Uncharacterized protein n=1 Tax=Streptomyces iranensis TaxID=576784 RepID=A0A060ZLB9_9ACTN|nr:hypothetical protein [Streptomyces iranensis]MBP2061048.1 hypothetical protein [Streptomyces iranensis]CDR06524.1 predicted protein [Streptomyces iranensis]